MSIEYKPNKDKNGSTTDNKGKEEYDRILQEIKDRAQKNAKEDISKLYQALTKNEGLESKDAGDKVKHDLVDTYSIETIRRYLPKEAKHQEKIRAKEKEEKEICGQLTANEDKNVLVSVNNDGKQEALDTATKNLDIPKSKIPTFNKPPSYAQLVQDNRKDTEIAMLKRRISELELKINTLEARQQQEQQSIKSERWIVVDTTLELQGQFIPVVVEFDTLKHRANVSIQG